MNSNKKAVIYLRVSTGKQAEKELPIESQQRECEQKALNLNADVLKVFSDEGISAKNDARPAFQNAIKYCETFDVDYFITWSTSRFARNRGDAYIYKTRLQKAGVNMAYVSVSIDETTPQGSVLAGVFELFDEYYSSQISADTRRSMAQIAKDGYWSGGWIPFGYQTIQDDTHPKKRKRLAPHSQESVIVNKIFDMRINGLGAQNIASTLNEQGYSYRGKKWIKQTVLRILKNEVLIGKIIFGRTRNNGIKVPKDEWLVVHSHSPIIDDTKWNTVQTLMKMDSNIPDTGSHKSTWRFTGLVRCGLCHSSMQIESAKGRNKRYYYYNCRNFQQHKQCVNRRMNANELEEFFISTIIDNIFSPERLKSVLHELNELSRNWGKDYKNKRAEISKELNNLYQNNETLYGYLENPDGALNLGDLSPRLRKNNNRIKSLETELKDIEERKAPDIHIKETDINELQIFLAEVIRDNNRPRNIRSFISSFVKNITLDAKNLRIEYNPEVLITANLLVPNKELWLPNLDSNQEPSD